MNKNNNKIPEDKVYWYTQNSAKTFNKLSQDIQTDVVVIGGGMAGLSAAHAFRKKGLDVVLVEKDFCGAGASGKSSGFITPSSEYGLADLANKFGQKDAKKLWDFAILGSKIIEDNIKKYNIDCDYEIQDILIVANSEHKLKSEVIPEYNIRKKLGYDAKIYSKQELEKIIGSQNYCGGVSYSGSFAINAYKYCQAMSKVLQESDVKIFEKTTVTDITGQEIYIENNYKVKAKYIIVCVDRFLPELKKLQNDIYHVQTFLIASEPLADNIVKKIFPEKKYMTWDTDLIYQYWRLTKDNRLIIGGSNIFYVYAKNKVHNSNCVYKKLKNYFKTKFPDLNINFEYMWPGFIGISKDVIPIAGRDLKNKNTYYISAATGLHWCAALGNYCAQNLLKNNNEFDKYFSQSRKYPINNFLQKILGKRLTFAISNLLSLRSI